MYQLLYQLLYHYCTHLNNQIFLPRLPGNSGNSRQLPNYRNYPATVQVNNQVPAPSSTSSVSSNPANLNNENDNDLVTVSNNTVTPLSLSEVQRLSIDDIRKALFVHTLYIQNVYNLKSENGWTVLTHTVMLNRNCY